MVGVERPKSVAIHDIRPNCATVAPLPFERVRSCPTDPRSSPVPSDDSPSCTSEIHVTVIERIHAELVSVSLASVSAPSSLTRGCLTPGPVLTKLLSKLGIINAWGLYSPFALAILADVSRDGSEGSPRSTLNCSRSTQPLERPHAAVRLPRRSQRDRTSHTVDSRCSRSGE